jgi:hypothetical protein
MPLELLCGKVAGLSVHLPSLVEYYRRVVEPAPATQYHDNDAAYEGWALSSRDGTISDGVQRIDRQATKAAGNKRRGVQPTPLMQGYAAELEQQLVALGLNPHRIRVMRLAHEGFEMKWHRDADAESWRLHIPIITSAHSQFEWKLAGEQIVGVHLPADGSGWLVRVDELHRAVNRNPAGGFRVHLLMSLSGVPPREMFAPPLLVKPS